MSTVLPFPRARHQPFVLKHARNVAAMSHEAGERYLQQQLAVQVETMARRGIAPERIDEERLRLERAIRSTLWHFIIRQPGDRA
ncbi:DUF6074 family protein [Microvirga flavescens]|uniref:DUF6074 family protein n=1 Tax=Microvirga flavescens TaxID=2249811 RepID=UPI000DD928A9|nr:DUF6074 family protein [Microvirga flavescens]